MACSIMAAMPTPAATDDKDIIALNAQVATLSEKHAQVQRENVQVRVQVAWLQRQIFGKKSERRVVASDAAQGTLGQAFDAAPEMPVPGKKTRVASHERQATPKQPDTDESTLFFDEKKVPVEVIALTNPEVEGLAPEQYDARRGHRAP
jgi:transposase